MVRAVEAAQTPLDTDAALAANSGRGTAHQEERHQASPEAEERGRIRLRIFHLPGRSTCARNWSQLLCKVMCKYRDTFIAPSRPRVLPYDMGENSDSPLGGLPVSLAWTTKNEVCRQPPRAGGLGAAGNCLNSTLEQENPWFPNSSLPLLFLAASLNCFYT